MNRSPAIAGVLSVLFPGLGHLYAGAVSRGFALAAIFFATLQTVIHTGFAAGGLAVLGIWLFGILDAVRVAEETAQARAEGRRPDISLDRSWALGLVLVGAVAILAVIPGIGWTARLWPLLLLWIGVQHLRGRPVIPGFLRSAEEAPDPLPTDGAIRSAGAEERNLELGGGGSAPPKPPGKE